MVTSDVSVTQRVIKVTLFVASQTKPTVSMEFSTTGSLTAGTLPETSTPSPICEYSDVQYSSSTRLCTRISKTFALSDRINYPWTVSHEFQGQNLDECPYFKRWFNEIGAREAVKKGMAAGSDLAEDYTKISQEEKDRRAKILYNQRARPAPAGGLL